MDRRRARPYEKPSAVPPTNYRSRKAPQSNTSGSTRESAPPDYLMDILRFHLGFVLPLTNEKYYGIHATKAWKHTAATLSCSQRIGGENDFSPIIIRFLEAISDKKENEWTKEQQRLLSDVWDLMEDNYMSLWTGANRTKARHLIPIPKPVGQRDTRGSDHQYIILGNMEMQFAFTQPMDVVNALRWGNIPVKDIAFRFLKHGVSFQMLVSLDKGWKAQKDRNPNEANHRPIRFKIPYRGYGHQFTPQDYKEVEKTMAKILSQPHARAAQLYGSIIWRLTADYVNDEVDVMAGPSKTATVYGHGYYVDCGSGINKQKFCDDMLSANELDLICGPYQVEISEPAPGSNKSSQMTLKT